MTFKSTVPGQVEPGQSGPRREHSHGQGTEHFSFRLKEIVLKFLTDNSNTHLIKTKTNSARKKKNGS